MTRRRFLSTALVLAPALLLQGCRSPAPEPEPPLADIANPEFSPLKVPPIEGKRVAFPGGTIIVPPSFEAVNPRGSRWQSEGSDLVLIFSEGPCIADGDTPYTVEGLLRQDYGYANNGKGYNCEALYPYELEGVPGFLRVHRGSDDIIAHLMWNGYWKSEADSELHNTLLEFQFPRGHYPAYRPKIWGMLSSVQWTE